VEYGEDCGEDFFVSEEGTIGREFGRFNESF